MPGAAREGPGRFAVGCSLASSGRRGADADLQEGGRVGEPQAREYLNQMTRTRLAPAAEVPQAQGRGRTRNRGDRAFRMEEQARSQHRGYKGKNTSEEQSSVATFSVISAASAPKAAKTSGHLTARMHEFDSYIVAVKSGQVGKLAPSAGETARGISLRVARAAKRQGKTVETWVANDLVYFKVS